MKNYDLMAILEIIIVWIILSIMYFFYKKYTM